MERRVAANERLLQDARRRADEEVAACSALRERCTAHGKERKALTGVTRRQHSPREPFSRLAISARSRIVASAAILENKAQTLIERVVGLLHQSEPRSSGMPDGGNAVQAARRELDALQRLVAASVSALKLPEATK